jgi:hypothetical protein
VGGGSVLKAIRAVDRGVVAAAGIV